MDEWIKNSDQIIADYPEDFAVQSPEDEKFMQDYVKNVFDFQQKSVYLTPEWVENEEGVFDLIQDAGVIERGHGRSRSTRSSTRRPARSPRRSGARGVAVESRQAPRSDTRTTPG